MPAPSAEPPALEPTKVVTFGYAYGRGVGNDEREAVAVADADAIVVGMAVTVGAALAEAAFEGKGDGRADLLAVGVGGAVGATGAMRRTRWFSESATSRAPATGS